MIYPFLCKILVLYQNNLILKQSTCLGIQPDFAGGGVLQSWNRECDWTGLQHSKGKPRRERTCSVVQKKGELLAPDLLQRETQRNSALAEQRTPGGRLCSKTEVFASGGDCSKKTKLAVSNQKKKKKSDLLALSKTVSWKEILTRTQLREGDQSKPTACRGKEMTVSYTYLFLAFPLFYILYFSIIYGW